MKIYVVCGGWDYEGEVLLKAFNDVRDAEKYQDEFVYDNVWYTHPSEPYTHYDFLDITEMELE